MFQLVHWYEPLWRSLPNYYRNTKSIFSQVMVYTHSFLIFWKLNIFFMAGKVIGCFGTIHISYLGDATSQMGCCCSWIFVFFCFLDELLTVEDPPLGNNQFLYSIDSICIIILKSESVWPQGFWKRDCVPEMQKQITFLLVKLIKAGLPLPDVFCPEFKSNPFSFFSFLPNTEMTWKSFNFYIEVLYEFSDFNAISTKAFWSLMLLCDLYCLPKLKSSLVNFWNSESHLFINSIVYKYRFPKALTLLKLTFN